MTFCTCWRDYPNPAHKKKNGRWLCVDSYRCIRKREGYKVKTKCVKEKKNEQTLLS